MGRSPARTTSPRRVLTLIAGPGLALLDELVGPGDLVVDAGANRGVFTVRLSELVGPAGRVLAFEPNPECVRRLEQIAGAAGNVVVHASALSDVPGVAVLHVPVRSGTPPRRARAPGARSRRATRSRSPSRPSRSTRFSTPRTGRVRFVKCDVEGHELAVLRGAARRARGRAAGVARRDRVAPCRRSHARDVRASPGSGIRGRGRDAGRAPAAERVRPRTRSARPSR